MKHSRRNFLRTAAAALSVGAPAGRLPAAKPPPKKTHLVTLSFDDGFKKSFLKTAETCEKHGLSACLNVIATGHQRDFDPPRPSLAGRPLADFGLWNELQVRGHEIMPHSYKHANLRALPFAEAKSLISQCLDIFARNLKDFDAKIAVYNFAYNASTPELEEWLSLQVRAFRTGGGAINRLPSPKQKRLTCTSFGPGNAEKALDREIEKLLAEESGWLIFNTHGLDDEGWGPIGSDYLDRLLARLTEIESVDVIPSGRALAKYADNQAPSQRKTDQP